MTQITSENIANNTITTSQIATTAVASLQGPRISAITITDGSYSALDDSAVSTSGGYIKISGANFASGCSVVIGTTSATTVTFTSTTELHVAVPALSAGSYTVYVTNTDGGLAIKVNGLTYSAFPAWSTSATLTPGYETTNVSVSLSATSDSSITYTVNAGSTLPSGLSLSSGGLLSGTLPAVASDTNYSFVIQATDAELQNTPRTFSLNDQADVINWTTPAANNTVYSGQAGVSFSQSLLANSLAGYSATITANSLPTGLSISGNVITGTPSVVANTATLLTANAATSYKTGMRLIYINIIVAADPYFNLTTMATHASANVSLANGTVISDASTNAFEMTVAGTPRASNFTPFGTGWSMYFNGSAELSVSDTSIINLINTTNYTVEAWVYPTVALPGGAYSQILGSGVVGGISFGFYNGTPYITNNSAGLVNGGTPIIRAWNHIALVNTASTGANLYFNGSLVGTDTAYTFSAATTYVGSNGATQYFTGYISNLRIVKGTAVYTGASLTIPTAPLTAIANTKLLVCSSNRFVDISANAYSITATGSPTIQSFNPFNLTNTGSDGAMYFNGSTDHLTTATATPLVLSGSVYTIECWCYLTSNDFSSYRILVMKRVASTAASYNIFFNITNGYLAFYNGTQYTSTTAPPINAWNHVAAVYDGTNINLFMNGVRVLQTATTNPDNGGSLWIGVEADASTNRFIGYISNIRILKGTALYSGTTYTIPTVPLTAITNTSLLTLQNKYSHNTTQGHQDSSTNQLLITSAGSPAAGTFSPFSQTGWSTYFNGSSDYMSWGTTALNFLATGSTAGIAATIEAWVYTTAYNAGASAWQYNPVIALGGTYMNFGVLSGKVRFYWYDGGYQSVTSANTSDVPLNTWVHICVTISTTTIKLYVNGTLNTTSATYTGIASAGANNSVYVSYEGNSGYKHTGYISNLRVVNDIVYTGTFTPSTTPLTAIANTKLLVFQDNRFIDRSTNAFTATITSGPSIQAFSPFAPTAAYSVNTVGGSVYTGTTSDWINVANSNSLKLSTSNFTIECWIYFINPNSQTYYGIFAKRTADASYGYMLFGLNSSFGLILLASSNGSGWDIANSSGSTALKKNAWYHVALVRSGSSIKAYLNGALEITVTSSAAIYDNTAALSIGNWSETQSSYPFIGYISNFRFQIGTAQYTTTFTPPTSLVTATANTNVLVNGTSTALTDVTSRTNMITVSTAKISTARSKYGTGSMYFNGSSDYISMPVNVGIQATENFTIEFWVYSTVGGTQQTFVSLGNGINIWKNTSNQLVVDDGSTGQSAWTGVTISLNQWVHIAVVKNGSTTTGYINGAATGSHTFTPGSITTINIGRFWTGSYYYFTGYIDDLRITKYARYTTNFTPMTETFNDK